MSFPITINESGAVVISEWEEKPVTIATVDRSNANWTRLLDASLECVGILRVAPWIDIKDGIIGARVVDMDGPTVFLWEGLLLADSIDGAESAREILYQMFAKDN